MTADIRRSSRARRNRALALAALILLLLAPAGCAGPEPEPTATPAATLRTGPLTPLTMMMPGPAPDADSPVLALLARQAGVEITLRVVEASGYDAALTRALAAGTLSDLTVMEPAQAWAWQDLFTDFSGLLALAPSLTAALSEYPDLTPRDDQGRIFALPTRLVGPEADGGWWTPQDLQGTSLRRLLDSAGEDQIGLCVPGGIDGLMEQAAPLFGATTGFMTVRGETVYGPTAAAFSDCLSWLAGLYAEGSLDPFFAVRTQDSWLDLARQGRIVVTLAPREQWETLSGLGYALSVPPRVGGGQPRVATRQAGAEQWMALSAACSHPEAAMALLDACFTPQGVDLLNWGVPGVNAERDDAGRLVLLPPWDVSGLAILRTQGAHGLNFPGYYESSSVVLLPALRPAAMTLDVRYLLPASGAAQLAPATGDRAVARRLARGAVLPLAQSWWIDFITGVKDPRADWNEYLTALEDAGLARWIDP